MVRLELALDKSFAQACGAIRVSARLAANILELNDCSLRCQARDPETGRFARWTWRQPASKPPLAECEDRPSQLPEIPLLLIDWVTQDAACRAAIVRSANMA